MAASGQGAKRKQDDFGLLAARTEQGVSGSVNWPQFDELAPIRSVRSAARGSVPASCGPLLAGAPALLPALTPRNYHVTGPHELGVPYSYAEHVSEQLAWLQATHPHAFVPRQLLTDLLRQELLTHCTGSDRYAAPREEGAVRRMPSASIAAGFPSYDVLAAHLKGNTLAAVDVPLPAVHGAGIGASGSGTGTETGIGTRAGAGAGQMADGGHRLGDNEKGPEARATAGAAAVTEGAGMGPACPQPSRVTLMFGATGQVGEVLTLTVLRRAGEGVGAAAGPGAAGGGGSGGGSSGGQQAEDAPQLEAYPAAHLSLNKSIWQIAVKPQPVSVPPQLWAQGQGQEGQGHARGYGGGGAGQAAGPGCAPGPSAAPLHVRQRQQHGTGSGPGVGSGAGAGAGAPLSLPCWEAAAVAAGGSLPADGGGGGGAAAAAGCPTPGVWVAVRCNYRVDVLLAYLVDPRDWRSWRLEWRATHPTPRPTAAIAWSPHLPELAFALSDGSVALADVASVAAAAAGSGSVTAAPPPAPAPHSPAAHAAATGSGQPPGAARGGREGGGGGGARLCALSVRRALKAVVEPPARKGAAKGRGRWREPEVVGRGRICLAYGVHPRQLFVARDRQVLAVELRAPGVRHGVRLLFQAGKRDGQLWALESAASLPCCPQLGPSSCVPPHALHLLLLATDRDVLLIDPRRAPSGRGAPPPLGPAAASLSPVLAAAPHGLPPGQLPSLCALSVRPWVWGEEGRHGGRGRGQGHGQERGRAEGRQTRHEGGRRGDEGGAGGQQDVEMEMGGGDRRDGEDGGRHVAGHGELEHQAAAAGFAFQSQFADFDPLSPGGPGGAAAVAAGVTPPARTPHVPYGTQASQHVDDLLMLLGQGVDRGGPNATGGYGATPGTAGLGPGAHGGVAQGARSAVEAAAAAGGPVTRRAAAHVCWLLANGGSGDVVCFEAVVEDAPFALRVFAPPVPTTLEPDDMGALRLPHLQRLVPAPPPPPPATTSTTAHAPRQHPQRSRDPSGAVPSRPPSLASDAAWKPACLAHLHVLGLPYPPCRTVRQDLGGPLVSVLEGARAAAYGSAEQRRWVGHPYGYQRLAALNAELQHAARHSPDLQGLALLPLPATAGGPLRPSSQPHVPQLLLLRQSHDGDVAVQPLARLPPGAPLPTRADQAVAAALRAGAAGAGVEAGPVVGAAGGPGAGAGAVEGGAQTKAGAGGAQGVRVRMLDSPHLLADLSARLTPASYEPLLRAHRCVSAALAATAHLPAAGWPDPASAAGLSLPHLVPPTDHLARRGPQHLSLMHHNTHMGELLRWASGKGPGKAGRGRGPGGHKRRRVEQPDGVAGGGDGGEGLEQAGGGVRGQADEEREAAGEGPGDEEEEAGGSSSGEEPAWSDLLPVLLPDGGEEICAPEGTWRQGDMHQQQEAADGNVRDMPMSGSGASPHAPHGPNGLNHPAEAEYGSQPPPLFMATQKAHGSLEEEVWGGGRVAGAAAAAGVGGAGTAGAAGGMRRGTAAPEGGGGGGGGGRSGRGDLPAWGFSTAGVALVGRRRPRRLPRGVWGLVRAGEERGEGSKGTHASEADEGAEGGEQGGEAGGSGAPSGGHLPAGGAAAAGGARGESGGRGGHSSAAQRAAAQVVRQAVRQRLQAYPYSVLLLELGQAAVDAAAAYEVSEAAARKGSRRVIGGGPKGLPAEVLLPPATAAQRLQFTRSLQQKEAAAAGSGGQGDAVQPPDSGKAKGAASRGEAGSAHQGAASEGPAAPSLWDLELQERALMAVELGRLVRGGALGMGGRELEGNGVQDAAAAEAGEPAGAAGKAREDASRALVGLQYHSLRWPLPVAAAEAAQADPLTGVCGGPGGAAAGEAGVAVAVTVTVPRAGSPEAGLLGLPRQLPPRTGTRGVQAGGGPVPVSCADVGEGMGMGSEGRDGGDAEQGNESKDADDAGRKGKQAGLAGEVQCPPHDSPAALLGYLDSLVALQPAAMQPAAAVLVPPPPPAAVVAAAAPADPHRPGRLHAAAGAPLGAAAPASAPAASQATVVLQAATQASQPPRHPAARRVPPPPPPPRTDHALRPSRPAAMAAAWDAGEGPAAAVALTAAGAAALEQLLADWPGADGVDSIGDGILGTGEGSTADAGEGYGHGGLAAGGEGALGLGPRRGHGAGRGLSRFGREAGRGAGVEQEWGDAPLGIGYAPPYLVGAALQLHPPPHVVRQEAEAREQQEQQQQQQQQQQPPGAAGRVMHSAPAGAGSGAYGTGLYGTGAYGPNWEAPTGTEPQGRPVGSPRVAPGAQGPGPSVAAAADTRAATVHAAERAAPPEAPLGPPAQKRQRRQEAATAGAGAGGFVPLELPGLAPPMAQAAVPAPAVLPVPGAARAPTAAPVVSEAHHHAQASGAVAGATARLAAAQQLRGAGLGTAAAPAAGAGGSINPVSGSQPQPQALPLLQPFPGMPQLPMSQASTQPPRQQQKPKAAARTFMEGF